MPMMVCCARRPCCDPGAGGGGALGNGACAGASPVGDPMPMTVPANGRGGALAEGPAAAGAAKPTTVLSKLTSAFPQCAQLGAFGGFCVPQCGHSLIGRTIPL